jgi:hypothetical protein
LTVSVTVPKLHGFVELVSLQLKLELKHEAGESMVSAPMMNNVMKDEDVLDNLDEQYAYLKEHVKLYLAERGKRRGEEYARMVELEKYFKDKYS